MFVVSDPVRQGEPRGKVFEDDGEQNNSLASTQPLIIETPPPSDLVVTGVTAPPTMEVGGQQISLTWTVKNQLPQTARGSWTDSVYLSDDDTWDVTDRLLGRKEHIGDLANGDSYTSSLSADIPPLKPGQYRIIVLSGHL